MQCVSMCIGLLDIIGMYFVNFLAFVCSVNVSKDKYSYCFRILMSADDLTDAKLVQESESTIPPKN